MIGQTSLFGSNFLKKSMPEVIPKRIFIRNQSDFHKTPGTCFEYDFEVLRKDYVWKDHV